MKMIPEKWRGSEKLNTFGGIQEMTIINEAGLYCLIMKSRHKIANKFKKWITEEILPSIREFGYYKMKERSQNKIKQLMDSINFLQKKVNFMEEELKENKYPDGALFYVLDYSENNEEIYRIGKTDDIKKIKRLYDTHML